MNRFIILKAKLGYNPHRDKKGRFASANSVSGKDSGLKKIGNPGKEPSDKETKKIANVLGWNYNKEDEKDKLKKIDENPYYTSNPFEQTSFYDKTENDLSKITGFSQEQVKLGLKQWRKTSNDSYAAINMQKSASEEFGVPMSDYQKEKLNNYQGDNKKERSFGVKETPENRDELISQERKLLRTMYNETQKRLKDAGIDKVVVYRGFSSGENLPKGQRTRLTSNTLESWTLNQDMAKTYQNAVRMEVPVERVLSSYVTGFGTAFESEVVVFGNSEDIGEVI